MQSATDNALEIVADLGLSNNKGRQEKITNENFRYRQRGIQR